MKTSLKLNLETLRTLGSTESLAVAGGSYTMSIYLACPTEYTQRNSVATGGIACSRPTSGGITGDI